MSMPPVSASSLITDTMTDVTCSLENPLAANVSMPFPAMLISSGAERSFSVMQDRMSDAMAFGSHAPFSMGICMIFPLAAFSVSLSPAVEKSAANATVRSAFSAFSRVRCAYPPSDIVKRTPSPSSGSAVRLICPPITSPLKTYLIPAFSRESFKASLQNCGKAFDCGQLRMSLTTVIPLRLRFAMNSSIGRLEWPMVKTAPLCIEPYRASSKVLTSEEAA